MTNAASQNGTSKLEHRGRIQAQGGGIEESRPWARATPPTEAEGHQLLDDLRNGLDNPEKDLRVEAFAEARAWIQAAASAGGSGVIKKSFPRKPRKDHRRVDIEVIKSLAFVR